MENNIKKINLDRKKETIAILTINGLDEMCQDDLIYLKEWLDDKREEVSKIITGKINSFDYSSQYRSRLLV